MCNIKIEFREIIGNESDINWLFCTIILMEQIGHLKVRKYIVLFTFY
jgi:hypothetical protein